jgi:4-aminobutyrate aminotransferase-like enzyme
MSKELIARHKQLLGSATLFYDAPINIVRGEGAWLFDKQGKRYLDMYNNVPCVGHANPHVVEAVSRQMATLSVHSRYLHEGVLDYAERLLALHHDSLDNVIFACSGTEAVDIALNMARFATGGQGIICTDATYHGNSTEVRKMSRTSRSGAPVDRNFRAIPFPETYRPIKEGLSGSDLTNACLDEVQAAIDDFRDNNIPFAGMIVCSILANEGLPDIPVNFMPRATALVHEAGGLMIADEIQAGYCRSGSWWGYETTDFTPDIAAMGKPMGNGLPLSAVVANHKPVDTFRERTRYFNTFASGPLQAAAGAAVLDVIEDENLLAVSSELGDYLRTELGKMQKENAAMAEVRGCGLFVGIEWVSNPDTKEADPAGAWKAVNIMKDKGFLIGSAGAGNNVVKIRPPLILQKEQADLFLTAFEEMLKQY